MLKLVSRLSHRHPFLIISIICAVTVFMAYQILSNLLFEPDITKSLPQDMPAMKAEDYAIKNFNYQDTILVGIEKHSGSVLEPDTLRAIEKITMSMGGFKVEKSFRSKLTGKHETFTLPVGFDEQNILSVTSLEDIILDPKTGAVAVGNIIKNLKKELDIPSIKGEEALLPKSDEDIRAIAEKLKEIILKDRTFKGAILSEDLRASTISVSLVSKEDVKQRYALSELSTALDKNKLKSRFQGRDPNFPFQIYGKTIDGITVDDEYIARRTEEMSLKLKEWLIDFFANSFENNPKIQELLTGPLTSEKFEKIINHTRAKDFFMGSDIKNWLQFTITLWQFTIDEIDPFSRENLEFTLADVTDIYNLHSVYNVINDLLRDNPIEGASFHVAGQPIVLALFTHMMSGDMQLMVPIAVSVIFLILGISYRSARGVFIPSITVMLAVIWTLGLMAIFGSPITITTSVLPIVLLAIGTAYGIHLLNRYYEDALFLKDRREIIESVIQHVGRAVAMAAITTMAGFSSLSSSSLQIIRNFGIYSAIGVGFALAITLTLTPALLILWKRPKRNIFANTDLNRQDDLFAKIMGGAARKVIRRSGAVIGISVLLFSFSAFLMSKTYFEGSLMNMFKEDNLIFKSDRFLNKNLTGTALVNLVFKFRPQINLESPEMQKKLKDHLESFGRSWKLMIQESDQLDEAGKTIALEMGEKLSASDSRTINVDTLVNRIQLVKDVLNEDYMIETEEDPESFSTFPENDPESSSLEDLAEESSESSSLENLAEESSLEDLAEEASLEYLSEEVPSEETSASDLSEDLSQEQVLGLQDINGRMGKEQAEWKTTAEVVIKLREVRLSGSGLGMRRQFNLLQDLLAVDMKQPLVMHKLEELYGFLKDMKTPTATIGGEEYAPSGMIVTPVDLIRKTYKVFYHDNKPGFDRLPDVAKDGFKDKTLTDRSIIGVLLDQAFSAKRGTFETMVSPDLKEFQVKILAKSDSTPFIKEYLDNISKKLEELFPENDPYIELIRPSGHATTSMAISELIGMSQAKSIALSFVLVLVVTFFIFRSLLGGFYSLIPLLFTVILNFGVMYFMGGEITTGTMMVASIAIGTGIDYTIHFLERLKIQLAKGDVLEEAYVNTITTVGRAIALNATSVALGFLVLVFSNFTPTIALGVLMAGTMLFSTIGALIILPAIILVTRPAFLNVRAASQS